MPASTSSHSRTATNSSSQLSSSLSSTRLPYTRSAAGSFSTIYSDPFLHADALDSTTQLVPSYYLDDVSQQESPVNSPRRNALVPPPSASEYSSKVSLLPPGLMRLIRTSALEQLTQQMLLAMVRMIVYISCKLFPPASMTHESLLYEIQQIAQDACEFLDLVLQKLFQRIATAKAAQAKLAAHRGHKELPLEEVVEWIELVDGLHKPTHVEAKIFRRMATLFEEFVYMPFLQLHRREPDHNMYALDAHLQAIFIRLRTITNDAMTADNAVRNIEKTLDAAMAPVAADSKRHTPSKSMPTVRLPRVLELRQRENTL